MTNSVESGRYRSQPSRPTVKMSGAFHAPPLTVPPVFAKGQSKRESPKNEPHLRSSNLNFFSPTIGVQSKNVFPPISILGEEQIVFKSGLIDGWIVRCVAEAVFFVRTLFKYRLSFAGYGSQCGCIEPSGGEGSVHTRQQIHSDALMTRRFCSETVERLSK